MSLNEIDVTIYAACKMTGRDRHEQVKRAEYMRDVFALYGVRVISPVLEEHIPDLPGPLRENDRGRLRGNWRDDKDIMAYRAHVTVMDGGDEGSVGMGREYGFNRYALCKPTVTLWNKDRGLTVAEFEDDGIFLSPHMCAAYIAEKWGTRRKRIIWRLKMLVRSLPTFLKRQIYAFK